MRALLILVLLGLAGCTIAHGPSGKSYWMPRDAEAFDAECRAHFLATHRLAPQVEEAILARVLVQGMTEEEIAAALDFYDDRGLPALPPPQDILVSQDTETWWYHATSPYTEPRIVYLLWREGHLADWTLRG